MGMKENNRLIKKISSIQVTAAVFFFIAVFAWGTSSPERDLFERFSAAMSKNRPQSFSCRITGDAIANALARIPAEAYTSKTPPEVHTYFERGRGQVLRVLYVDEYHRNMFSSYLPYLGMTGAWIEARGDTWEAFSRDHEMKIMSEDASDYTVKISRRSEDGSAYAVFRFAKAGYFVRSAQLYNADILSYSVANEYGATGNFTLPTAMTITSWRDGRAASVSRLVFSDYRINIPIPAGVFQR
jgi:hypothetical protein